MSYLDMRALEHFTMQLRQGSQRSFQNGSKGKSLFWQQFVSWDAPCVIQFKPNNSETPLIIFPTDEIKIHFNIYGGADIPQFRLQAFPNPKFFNKDEIACRPTSSIIYMAWTEETPQAQRTPTTYPDLAPPGRYTFSYMLQDVEYKTGSTYPDYVENAKNFHRTRSSVPTLVSWASSFKPAAFDTQSRLIRPERLDKQQEESVNQFMRLWRKLARADVSKIRVFVAGHGSVLEAWKFLTALPHPPPRPFHRYAKGPYPNQGAVISIDDCNEETYLGKFHGQRESPHESPLPPLATPYRVFPMFALSRFEHPGLYEVFHVGAVLRDYQYGERIRLGYVNQRWGFQLIPMSTIRASTRLTETYFVHLDIQEAIEEQHNFIQAPSTNTQVRISSGDSDFVGKVIASQGYKLLMCVKLSTGPSGRTLVNLNGRFEFGPAHTPYLAAKKGVQKAMYGGVDVKWFNELLLAHENRNVWTQDRGSIPDPLRPDQLAAIGFNSEQQDAFQRALALGDNPRAKMTICRGPPGTGKTLIAIQIIIFCLTRKYPVELVATNNAGVDIVCNGVMEELTRRQMPNHDIFRVRAGDLESIAGYHLADEDVDQADDDGDVLDNFDVAPVQDLYDISDQMISNFENYLKETLKFESDPLSFSAHMIDRLEALRSGRQVDPPLSGSEKALMASLIDAQLSITRLEEDISNTYPEDLRQMIRQLMEVGVGESAQDALMRYQYKLKRQFDKALLHLQRFYAQNSRVIFVTGATSAARFLRQCWRHTLIVDEAAQIKEYELVACVARLLPRLKKVILLGDPRQLPPLVIDEEHNEFSKTVGMSGMTRLMDTGIEYVALRVQYRMCPDIAEFVNSEFNDGRLINHSSVSNRPGKAIFTRFLGQYHRTISPKQTLFLHVPYSRLYRTKRSHSLVNPWYLEAIAQVVDSLLDAGAKPQEIAILSYYAAQLECHRAIKKPGVQLLTVDTSQGKEYQFVVLDTATPGGSKYKLGFITNTERMHVALSRARDGLVVVGDEEMAKDGSEKKGGAQWERLVNHHHKIGSLARLEVDPSWMHQRLDISGEQYERVPLKPATRRRN
ncbi:MAG: hypothetical protein Q9187_003103 [Circinaria calcarea]